MLHVPEATKCHNPDIEALLTISVPVDLEGDAFFLHSTPFGHEQCDLEFYHCKTCGDQFYNWEDAEKHKLGEE